MLVAFVACHHVWSPTLQATVCCWSRFYHSPAATVCVAARLAHSAIDHCRAIPQPGHHLLAPSQRCPPPPQRLGWKPRSRNHRRNDRPNRSRRPIWPSPRNWTKSPTSFRLPPVPPPSQRQSGPWVGCKSPQPHRRAAKLYSAAERRPRSSKPVSCDAEPWRVRINFQYFFVPTLSRQCAGGRVAPNAPSHDDPDVWPLTPPPHPLLPHFPCPFLQEPSHRTPGVAAAAQRWSPGERVPTGEVGTRPHKRPSRKGSSDWDRHRKRFEDPLPGQPSPLRADACFCGEWSLARLS